MKIWYDTEFLEDGRTIDLVSIGLVREDDAEYYAVSDETGWGTELHKRMCGHFWLMQNVVPHLPLRGGIERTGGNPGFTLDMSSPLIRPAYLIANEVRDFILAAPDPQLRAWYGAYDHVALMQLWGPMIRKPEGIPMWTFDLRQEAERLGNPAVPEQEAGEHNALADARHCRVIDQFLANLAAR